MNEEFSTTVFPIAFNIKISLVSSRYRIAAAYGSPEVSDTKPGTDVVLSTEFPSVKNSKGETRSGVILFRVDDLKSGTKHEPFEMRKTWDDLSGISCKDVQTLNFGHPETLPTTTPAEGTPAPATAEGTPAPAEGAPADVESEKSSWYQNSGVRKAILLVRYIDFFKKYLQIRAARSSDASLDLYLKMRQVYPAVVSYFRGEMEALEDPTLSQELNALIDIARLDDIPVDADNTTDNNNNNNNNNLTEAQLAARLSYLSVAAERYIDEDDDDY